MSAWLVSKRHVDAVVSTAIAHRAIDRSEADVTGSMLWGANADNLAYLYSDLDDDERNPGPYRFDPYPIEDPDVAHKAVQCLDYQSCDQKAWNESLAGRLLATLAETIAASIGTTPDGMYDRPGWETAPWGID